MSLDIDLLEETDEAWCACPCGASGHKKPENTVVYNTNITHNLSRMAKACGLEVLWDAEYTGPARDLTKSLSLALNELQASPDKYKVYNAINGFGNYRDFVEFCAELLKACQEHPTAKVAICK